MIVRRYWEMSQDASPYEVGGREWCPGAHRSKYQGGRVSCLSLQWLTPSPWCHQSPERFPQVSREDGVRILGAPGITSIPQILSVPSPELLLHGGRASPCKGATLGALLSWPMTHTLVVREVWECFMSAGGLQEKPSTSEN